MKLIGDVLGPEFTEPMDRGICPCGFTGDTESLSKHVEECPWVIKRLAAWAVRQKLYNALERL